MKTLKISRVIVVILLLQIPVFLSAQLQTLTLQPGPSTGKDAHIGKLNPNSNYGSSDDFMGLAWTCQSTPCGGRGIIEFDLSAIPSSAFVKEARLSLYHNNTSSNANSIHEMSNGVNDAILAFVTQPWSENTITWNNQPEIDNHRNVYLPKSTSPTQDYLDIDVTRFVREWVRKPASNNGMRLQLLNDSAYKALMFASSDHTNPAKRPKLEVEYYDNYPSTIDTLNIQLNAEDGFDAYMGYLNPNNNMGQQPDLMALAWTCSGDPCGGRGLFGFYLYWIPDTASIASAKLNLYQNYTSSNAGGSHQTISGDNDGFLSRVTEPWDENIVTWNTAPAFTADGQVYLPPSDSAHEDYLDIDITNFIRYWHVNPNKNYGMNLRLYTEQYYRSLIFASSEHSNTSLWPEMEVV
ncbi:MAG: DNRLRE domain-containing protein [Bacteroidales bacterium]|nr:DNRLRE domain-containing protein [Bacteroidales bacterium]